MISQTHISTEFAVNYLCVTECQNHFGDYSTVSFFSNEMRIGSTSYEIDYDHRWNDLVDYRPACHVPTIEKPSSLIFDDNPFLTIYISVGNIDSIYRKIDSMFATD